MPFLVEEQHEGEPLLRRVLRLLVHLAIVHVHLARDTRFPQRRRHARVFRLEGFIHAEDEHLRDGFRLLVHVHDARVDQLEAQTRQADRNADTGQFPVDDLEAKINYYAPALSAVTTAAPFADGKLWEIRGKIGKSFN